jgi:hypothetical protein
MYAYELLPRLIYLTLSGKDEDGYEFIGTLKQWHEMEKMEEELCQQ